MHKVLVNHIGGLSLPRKSVVRLTDRPNMILDVYHGRKTTKQQQQEPIYCCVTEFSIGWPAKLDFKLPACCIITERL